MTSFKLEIASPSKRIFEGKINKITLPGKEGRIGILKGHAPFLACLEKGAINVTADGEEQVFDIEGGFVEVNEKCVTVLLD